MATYTYIHLNDREGLRVLDLAGVEYDLTKCIEICGALKSQPNDRLVLEGLAIAVLTTYGRIFSGGVRQVGKIPADQILSAEEFQFHEQLLHMRSKHVAHSINSMEMPRIRIWLNPAERGKQVNNVNAEVVMLVALGIADYEAMQNVCSKLLDWVRKEKETEEVRMKAYVIKTYPLEKLYLMQADVSDSGGLDDVGRGRSR